MINQRKLIIHFVSIDDHNFHFHTCEAQLNSYQHVIFPHPAPLILHAVLLENHLPAQCHDPAFDLLRL